MSRLWDTPDYWARYEADETLREMPDAEPAALADELELRGANYDDGIEMAALIVADLRRRAAAGIRFWSGPQSLAKSVGIEVSGRTDVAADNGEVIDHEIPW